MKVIWTVVTVLLVLASVLTLRLVGVFDVKSNALTGANTASSDTAASSHKVMKYQIVFATKAGTITLPDAWQINVINDDSSRQTRITDTNGFPEPRWSTDGKLIAFLSKPENGKTGIYVMRTDGSVQTRLTPDDFWATCPGWSPDGKTIAFVSNMYSHDDNKDDICIMNSDGSNPVRLTSVSADHSDPCWSPDGSKIAYSAKQDDYLQIFIMNADGSNKRQITSSAASSSMPSWTPDGKRIAFTSKGNGKYQVYTMNADGSSQMALTDPGINNLGPFISPDGRKIAFVSDNNTNGLNTDNIFIMNIDGSNRTQLTFSSQDSCLCPSWCTVPVDISQQPSLTTITNNGFYDTNGFSIDYPSDWHIEHNSGGNMTIACPDKDGGFISFMTLPSMSHLVPNMPTESIETIVSRSIDSSKGVWKNFTIIENHQLSGTWDWKLVYSHTMESDGKNVPWKNTEYPFDQVASSFKILPEIGK
jgi:Tol biopolymer transport system component